MSLLIACYKNLLELATVSLSAGTEDTDYPLYRLYDRDVGKMFKPTAAETIEIKVAQNLALNPGFEADAGAGTNWTLLASTVETNGGIHSANSGTECLYMAPTGTAQQGARSAEITVDANKTYIASVYYRITNRIAGTLKGRIRCLDSSGAALDALNIFSIVENKAWEKATQTIGPAGSGADLTFPNGTKTIQVEQRADSSPDCDFWIDDVSFCEDSIDQLLIPSGHNLSGMTLDLKYSDYDDPAGYSDAVSQWTQSGNGVIDKSFAALQKPYWKFIITSPSSIPEIPEIFLSQSYTWERNPSRPSGPFDDRFNVERREDAGGRTRYLEHGDPRRYRNYQLPRAVSGQRTNIEALYDAWAGKKPFWIKDHEGNWIFGELISPLDLIEQSSNKHSFNFDFLEVLP